MAKLKTPVGSMLTLDRLLKRRIKKLYVYSKIKQTGNYYWKHKEAVYLRNRLKQLGII